MPNRRETTADNCIKEIEASIRPKKHTKKGAHEEKCEGRIWQAGEISPYESEESEKSEKQLSRISGNQLSVKFRRGKEVRGKWVGNIQSFRDW